MPVNSLRIFFIPEGMPISRYPRIMAMCHFCIEVRGMEFRSVKNKSTGATGSWQPIGILQEYINKLEEVNNAS